MEHNDIYENLNVTSEMNFNCVVKRCVFAKHASVPFEVRFVYLSDVLPNFLSHTHYRAETLSSLTRLWSSPPVSPSLVNHAVYSVVTRD
jgi:hypothetical protein